MFFPLLPRSLWILKNTSLGCFGSQVASVYQTSSSGSSQFLYGKLTSFSMKRGNALGLSFSHHPYDVYLCQWFWKESQKKAFGKNEQMSYQIYKHSHLALWANEKCFQNTFLINFNRIKFVLIWIKYYLLFILVSCEKCSLASISTSSDEKMKHSLILLHQWTIQVSG